MKHKLLVNSFYTIMLILFGFGCVPIGHKNTRKTYIQKKQKSELQSQNHKNAQRIWKIALKKMSSRGYELKPISGLGEFGIVRPYNRMIIRPLNSSKIDGFHYTQITLDDHKRIKRFKKGKFKSLDIRVVPSKSAKVQSYVAIAVLDPEIEFHRCKRCKIKRREMKLSDGRTLLYERVPFSTESGYARDYKFSVSVKGEGMVIIAVMEHQIFGDGQNQINHSHNDIKNGRLFGIGLGDSAIRISNFLEIYSLGKKTKSPNSCTRFRGNIDKWYRYVGMYENKNKLSFAGTNRKSPFRMTSSKNKLISYSMELKLPRKLSGGELIDAFIEKLGEATKVTPSTRRRYQSWLWKKDNLRVKLTRKQYHYLVNVSNPSIKCN